jgi:class 3 adenylate cyclase
MARMMRSAVSPARARLLWRRLYETDARDVLGAVHVPTLVLTRAGATTPERVTWITSRIDGSVAVALPGDDMMPWYGDLDAVLDAIRAFLGVAHEQARADRFLATVLFTDIVGSTRLTADLGDRAWRQRLEEHHRLVRERLARFGGREQDTAGDGFFAAFDVPADAIRCGLAIAAAVPATGLRVRVGAHTGECQQVDGKVAGLAVSIGARVAALAAPDEMLVTSTAKDLVAGSGLSFEDAGEHALRGVPDRWRLYRVAG